MTKILYFGTDEFSARVLKTLVSQGFTVVGVVTQPDRPVGRKQEFTPSAVKVTATELHIPIFQPENLKKEPVLPPADVFVVCVYGQIIPAAVLAMAPRGALNIHPSLLPKYRGPSPIAAPLMNGDSATGVTIILLDEKMDHGPIIAQEKLAIGPDDTAVRLGVKLSEIGAKLLIAVLPDWIAGRVTPQPQNESRATFCKMITRDDGLIDWKKLATEIYNQYRGLTPWPGIWTLWNGARLKLLKIKKTSSRLSAVPLARGNQEIKKTPGTVIKSKNKLFVECSEDSIEIVELQLEGRKAMDAKTFLNGFKNFIGATLG